MAVLTSVKGRRVWMTIFGVSAVLAISPCLVHKPVTNPGP
jgi:hypothetical protein